MAADENRRKSFFDALVEDGYTFGKEESTERAAFDSLMNDPAWAKRTHKALVDDGWELDDFDTWYEDFGPEKKAEQPSADAPEKATANVQTVPSAHDEYEKAKKGVEQVGNWAMDANVPPSYPTSNSEEETAPKPLYAPGYGGESADQVRRLQADEGDEWRTTHETKEQPTTAATETPAQEVQAEQPAVAETETQQTEPVVQQAPVAEGGRFEFKLGSPTDRAKQMQQDLQNRVVANTAETLGMQEGVREFAGTQEVQDQMDSAIKGAVDEVNKEIAKRQSTNMVAAGGGAGMSGAVVYNAARAMSDMAPSKIADAAYGELDRQGIFDQYVQQKYGGNAANDGGDTNADEPKGEDALAELDEARRKEVERIMQKEAQVFAMEIQQQLVDRYKDSKKVGNAGEYIASSAFLNSIAGRIYQGLASRMGAREYLAMLNENLQGYDAGFATQGVAGAASMILDTPFFMLGGVAGGALTSMATRATTAMLGGTAVRFLSASPVVSGIGRIMQRALSSGGTFAGYETMSKGADLFADEKEYSVLDVVKALGGAAAEGFGTGVALGVIGGIPSEMTRNASRIGRFAGGATGFAGELGYFSYNDMKKYMEENGVEWDDVPVGQILGKQVVMLGLMRMQHIDQIIDRYKSKITKQWGMELTSDDLANLRDAGYWDGKGGLIDAEKFLYKFGSESYDFYRSIMSNDNIPLSTRSKLRYIVEGKMSPMGAAFDRDGNVYAATDPVSGSYDVQTVEKDGTYYVTTFDENGRVTQVLRFKNKKDATDYHNAVAGQVTVNVVRCGEMALGKMDPEALRQCKERFNNRMSGNKRIGNIDDILAKPFDQRTDAENALVADYGKELFWISTLPKEDPTLRLIEERTDAETGTFKQGTDKDGRPVTVKGEGETVVTTDMETGEVKMQRADAVVIEKEGTPEEAAAEAQQAAAEAAAAAAMTPQDELAATKAANAELAKQQHDTAPFFLHNGDQLVPLSDIQKRVDGTGYDVFDMNGEKIGTVAAEMIEDGDEVRQAEALQAEAEAKRAEEEARKAAEKAAEEAAKAEAKRIAERDKAAKEAIEKAANTVELDRLAESWTEEMPAEVREAWQKKRDKFVANEEAEREAKFLAEKEETSYTEAVDKVKAWDDAKIDATIEKAEKGLASDDLTDEQEAQTKGVLRALKEEKARREEERKLSYDPKSNKWRGVPGDIEIISSGKPSNKIGEIRGFTPNINIDLIYNERIGHTSARVYIQDANAESPHKITERLEKEGYVLDNSGEMGPYADFSDWDAAVGFEKHVREIEAEVQKEREKRNAPAPDWTIDTANEARERGYRMVNGERVERHAPVNHVAGGRRTVKFSDKTQDNVKGKYAVMDVKDLTPSHVNGHRNPEFFITEAQPKDRVDAASKVAATVIANNINPEEITGGVTAYTGSPVVNNRGEVIQGNNRSEALRLMTDESKKKYRDYLNEHSEDFGIYPEDLDGFENPVLVRMLDVSDEEAIRLGQMNAQDTESGGKQAIDPKTLITKLQNVKMLEGFLNAVMKGADDNDALTDLIVKNGYNALKYAREKDAINDTQLITYWDDKLKGLTPEGKVVVNGVFNSLLFEGGSEDLPTFFAALPKAAQRAILTIIPNELRVEPGKSIREKVQRAIQLYYNAKQGGGKTPKDYKSAIKFAQEANINPNMYGVTLNFDNFAVELAARIAYETQATLIARFAKYYQLANGTYSDMFVNNGEPEPPKGRKESFEGAFDTTTKLEENENRQSTTGPVGEGDDTGRREGRPAVAADAGGVGRNEPGRGPATNEGAARGVGEGAPSREVKKAEQPSMAADETGKGQPNTAGAETPKDEGPKEQPKAEEPKEEPKGEEQKKEKKHNFKVSDEEMDDLAAKIRAKFGRLNIGADPELLTLGLKYAFGKLERGVVKFADFCKEMVETFGDAIRPYLKQFYNSAKDDPDMTEELLNKMDSYEAVRAFDVMNFDKATVDNLKKVAEDTVRKAEEKKNVKPQTNKDNGIIRERSQAEDRGLGEGDRTEGEQSESGGVAGRDGERAGMSEVRAGGVAGQPTRSEVEAETEPEEKLNQNNYHEERDVKSSEDAGIPKAPAARFDANLDALELLAKLRKEGRQATAKERETLGRFSGFGGLGGMLERVANGETGSFSSEPARRKFEKLRERFEAIGMTRDELRELAKSANTAFYTPDKYVDTMWDIAMKLGFKGGRMLEGSAGIGRVLARIPGKLNSRSMITAVEIDPSTGEMLQHMYPDAKVHIAGFEKVDIPPKSVDLVMTNVPFGQQSVSDDKNRDIARMFGNLHDFCIAKNVRALKEGGIGIFITTSGTMDKSAKLRKWVTGQGDSDFIGAFRLPNNTFGGTGVTSDIIVIRKRVNGVKSENAIDVQDTVALRIVPIEKDETYSQSSKNYNPELPVSSKNHRKGQKVVVQQPLAINKYFAEHPEMMGGEMFLGVEKGDTYRPASSSLYPNEGQDIDKMVKDFVDGLKPEKAQPAASTDARKVRYTDAKEGTMSVEGGKVYVARRGENVEVPNKSRAKDGTFKGEDGKRYSQETIAKDYLGLKKALHDVLDYQLKNEGDEGLQPLLDVLNKQYDRFKQRYGNLHGNNPRVAWLGADNDFYSVQSLEKYSESKSMTGKVTVKTDKSDIMLGRVLNMQRDPEPKNAREAVIASINMKGDINPDYIAEKLGLTREEAEKQILDSGLGFREPESGNIEPSFVYLSGNVREKLKTAYVNSGLTEYGEPIAGVERTHDYDKNIEALRSVVPVDLPAHAISFGLGTTWIPTKIYADYIKETFGFDATPVMSGGNWVIPGADNHNPKNAVAGVVSDKLRTGRYGDHMRFTGAELMEAAMNNRSVQFVRTWKDSDGNSHTEYDKEATQRANTIIGDMKGAFMEWGAAKMQNDAEMAEQVRRIYNEKFNAVVPFKIGDEFLPEVYPGQVSELGGRPFRLMEHQRRAVMRNLLYPTLMDHEAGTGKTFTFITTAMEMRRIGTAKKPLIVVQNATVEQFSSSAKKIYPDAKVLTIGGGMTPTERKSKFEALRYNDWDMIIMAQSVFEEIPDSQASRMEYMQEKMEEIEQMVAAAKSAKTGASAATQAVLNNTIRDLERQKNEIIEKFSVNEAQTAPEGDKIDKRKEKSRANAQGKAEQMMSRKTDDVATFDDFGVDALMLDEAHNYKNFPITTSMTRGVKGIPKSQSKRSVSVYLKTRDILRKNGGKNVIMGTGTPISNTAGEMWVFMKYLLSKDVMEENAIDMFDNFVRNFGSIETLHEFGASGRYKESNRFASYQNIPELMRLWTICTDIVQAQDVVDDKLPDVVNGDGKVISGGINENPTDVFLEQSPSVLRLMRSIQRKLEWYDNLDGSQKKENSAVPIRMFLLASRLAIDPRLVDRNAPDEPVSKVNRAVDDIVKDLEKTKSYRGTVAVFCEQNTRWDYVRDANGEIVTDPNGKPRKVAGFNVFDDMKKKLVARGVPANEIAIIRGGATKAEKKQRERIFEMVNSGEIRVIMGSEQTVGTGVNIQERMHLGIHLDVPQKPSGYEQENKRIIRQGNLHKEWGIPVQIIRYGIKDTMDVTAYQMLNTKAKFIRSISDAMRFIEDPLSDRTIVDDDETTFGNTVAQLSGSEAAMLKNDAERAARKYETYEKQWKAGQAYAQNTIERGEKTVETFTNAIANTKEQKAEIAKLFPTGKIETIKVDGVECKTKEEIDAQFKELNKTLAEFDESKRNDSGFNDQTIRIPLEINGVKTRIFVKKSRLVDFDTQTREMKGRIVTDISTELPGIGGISVMGKYPKEVLNALEPFVSGSYFDDEISRLESHIEYTKREMEQARPLLGQPFKFAKELDATRRAVAELDKKMREEMAEKEARYSDQLQGMDIPDIDDIIRGMADEDEDEEDSGDEAMYGETDDSFVGRLRRQANEAIERHRQERQEREDMVDEALRLKYDGDEEAIAATKMALAALDRATGGRVVYETDESVRKMMSEKEQPNTAADGDATEFHIVKDKAEIERLENEPTIKVYRAMQLRDGKLYPPMAGKVNGEWQNPVELGQWERADEHPELADKDGKFKLDKGNGTSLKARYNPYFHTSRTPLNDQFSSAQNRPELVTVETEVPESELTSGYKADKAKDAVGAVEWKAGVVQSQLSGTRQVILSRWDKPVRIVPDSEVAQKIVEMFGDKKVVMPSNVVTPSLRSELEKLGVSFRDTDNRGRSVIAEMRTSDGTVYGWKDGRGVIHLSLDGLNADTPVHEYSHLWFEVLKRRNRELWQSVMDRVREALNTADSEGEEVRRVLDEILGDENYKNIRDDEERLTSEILARLSGKKGRERLNEAAREAVKNKSFSWKVKSAIYDVLDKLKDAVAKAWNWIGKNIFRADSDVKSFSNIDEITDRVLYDFYNGTDMGPDGGGGGRRGGEGTGRTGAYGEGGAEFYIGGRRSPEVEARQSILDMKGVKEVQDLATELKRLQDKQGWHLEDRPTGLKDGAGNPIMRKVWTASNDPNTIKMAAEDALRFVRDKVGGVLSKELGAMELKKILRDIAAASTSQELGRPLLEVSRIINDAIIRKVERQTNELMATKVEKLNDRGVPVGRLVDVEGRNLFNEIRKANTEILTTSVDTDLDRVKKEYNNLVTRRRRLAAGNPKEEDEAYWDATTNTYDSAHMAALEADISAKEIELEGLRAKHTSDIEANIAEAYDKLAADRDRLEDEIGAYNSAGAPVPPEVIEEYCTVLPIRENLAIMHEARLELAQIKKEWQQALDDLHSIKRAPGYMAARKAKQRECDNLEANYMIQQGVIRDAMIAVAEGVKTILDEGKDRLTLIREQELEHKKFLVADAIDDVKRPNLKVTHQEKADSAENPMWYRVVNTLADPMKSLNFMLQWIDENHANGEGKLYTRFMKDPEGVVGANDRLWQQKKKTRTDMDAKVLDVFGKKMGVNALQKKGGDSPFLKLGRDSKKDLGVDIEKYVSKKELTAMKSNEMVHPDVIGRFSSPDDVIDGYHKIRVKGLTKGNALYIWLTWQQADGQEKLVRMGYNQDSIDQIERALGPEYIEFARWITDDYLKGLRDKYFSPRHEELFGISMGDTPHYFPLKIDKSTVFDKRQIGEDQKNYMPSLMVPNLIKRNRNSSEIDTTTDALEVLNRYTDTMWQWWAMGPIIKDVNTLHASPRFKEYMEANRKGSFAELMKAFEVATGATAERERDVVNDIVGKLTSAGATAAIAFKTSIALKQFLSFDAFRAYAASPRFQAELTKNILTPWACMKWAYETLPSYEQRRDEGDMGMEFMRQENMFDVARYISKAGLYANRFIDRWTVAAGAKAVYDYSMRKLLSEGWDKNKAHRWSVIEAEITFNKSQQSSRPEFSSWAQKNGNAFTRSLLLFTNGPTGYARQIRLAQWNLYKMAQAAADGKVKGWSKRELHGNGSHHKAWTAAGALAAIAIFGLVLPSEWQLGGNTNNVSDIASFNSEMSDADWEAYKWAIAEGLLTDGTYIGSAVKSVVNGYDYEPIHLLNMINEIKDMAQEGEADPIMAHIVDTALKYQLGLDINTFATIWAGVKGMVTEDYDSETLPMDLYLNLLLMLHSNKTDRRGWARELYSKYGPTAYAKAYEKASMQNNTDRKVTQLAHEYVKNLNEDFYNDMMEWKPLTEEHNAKVTTPERRAEIEAMPEWQLAARYKDWIIPTMRANMLQQDSTGVAVKNNPNRYLSDSEIVNILNNEMIPQWKEFKKSQKDEEE